jgi:hypothetical protein
MSAEVRASAEMGSAAEVRAGAAEMASSAGVASASVSMRGYTEGERADDSSHDANCFRSFHIDSFTPAGRFSGSGLLALDRESCARVRRALSIFCSKKGWALQGGGAASRVWSTKKTKRHEKDLESANDANDANDDSSFV